MFTIDQVKAAHSNVKSGADFPNYIQDLITLGVQHYDTYVKDGHTEYTGSGNYKIESDPKYPEMKLEDTASPEKFKHFLKIHQNGETDYMTFCRHCAETGVEKWTVDTAAMTCTYYDKQWGLILEEKIPG